MITVKRTLLGMICIGCMFMLVGCGSIFGKSNRDSNLSKRGMRYYFDNKIYDTVINELQGRIEYNAPSMEGIIKDNVRIYYGDNNALVLWLGNEDKSVTKDKVINKYSEKMIENIEEVADIENVGVEFNVELLAKDKVNNINRNKYVGVINAIGKDGIETMVPINLSEEERSELVRSAEVLKEIIKGID